MAHAVLNLLANLLRLVLCRRVALQEICSIIPRRQRSLSLVIARMVDFVFGYDFFISYRWADGREDPAQPPQMLMQDKQVFTAALDTQGHRAVVGVMQGKGKLWDLTAAPPVARDIDFGDSVRPSFSHNGTPFATAGTNHIARVWNATDGTPLSPPLEHHDDVSYSVFSPGNSFLSTTERCIET